MITLTRTPFSANIRDTSKALSPPPMIATCEPKSAPGSPTALAPRCSRPVPAIRRAFFTRSSHSSPPNPVPVALTLPPPHNDFAGLPQKPLVGIGAHARDPAERTLLLDDDRVQAVIVQPQRAGHAGGTAPDDRHDRRLACHIPSPVARGATVRQSGSPPLRWICNSTD